MNKIWPWLLLALAVLLALVKSSPESHESQSKLLLNCSSELFDHDRQTEQQYFLLLDLQASGKKALVNYRYFHVDGAPAGSIMMSGDITRGTAGMSYQIAVTSKQEQAGKGDAPEHMQYLSYISQLNLANRAVHPMTFEILDTDDKLHYAVVRVQPGNGIYGCRIQQ